MFRSLLIIVLGAGGLGCLTDATPIGIRAVEIEPGDSILFSALGDTLPIEVRVIDVEGDRISPDGVALRTLNPSIARIINGNVLQARAVGSTILVASRGGQVDSVGISVTQIIDSLLVTSGIQPVTTVPPSGFLTLACRAFDANGQLLALPAVVQSATGRVQGSGCDHLVAQSSGFDTLTVTAGPYVTTIVLAIAIQPTLGSDPQDAFPVDSLPAGLKPWAPTLSRDPAGNLELYFAGYRTASEAANGLRGDLHRMVSADGVSFRYDGIALRRDAALCHPQGTGIENIAIVPRHGGSGWRMYYSAGGYDCYGWQVFSAVSPDRRHWSKESGARVGNGGTLPPVQSVNPPWPAGEGMTVDRAAGGDWRMLVGAYEHLTPRENKFQIVEWRSPDQLHWTYAGPVLTTREVGEEANRSIYSPSVVAVAPGLYRMFFGGDNLKDPGGRSRIYTAVSLDYHHWQVEAVLVGDAANDYYYATIDGDLLVFIRDPASKRHTLGSVRVIAP